METPTTVSQRHPVNKGGVTTVTKPFKIKNMLSLKQRKALAQKSKAPPKAAPKEKLADKMKAYPRLANESKKAWKLRIVKDLRAQTNAAKSPKPGVQAKSRALPKAKAIADGTVAGKPKTTTLLIYPKSWRKQKEDQDGKKPPYSVWPVKASSWEAKC